MQTFLRLLIFLNVAIAGLYSPVVTCASVKVWATDEACPALDPAISHINRVPFPDGWTIIIACTDTQWEMLQRKADAQATKHAFTNLKARMTVVHGSMFIEKSVARPARRVLLHEIGHVQCGCNDESRAERWALEFERGKRDAQTAKPVD